jgi:hypothetical protein
MPKTLFNSFIFGLSLLVTIVCRGQSLEFSEVRWGVSGDVARKVHIKDVLEFPDKSVAELHSAVISWYLEEYFNKGLGHSYRFHGVSGDFMWQSDTKKPLLVNKEDWIIPKAIKCEKCMIAWGGSKAKNDGIYALDIRLKEGKVLLVVADHYVLLENSFLSDWILKKGNLVKRPDPRIDVVEEEFEKLKASLYAYVQKFDPSAAKTVQPDQDGVDDW